MFYLNLKHKSEFLKSKSNYFKILKFQTQTTRKKSYEERDAQSYKDTV